jgi:predicted transcriptional regulator
MGTDIDQDKARHGILKFMTKNGGSVPMSLLHGHSKLMYGAAHQAFSQLMEGLVRDDLVSFDDEADTFQLTDKGRELASAAG